MAESVKSEESEKFQWEHKSDVHMLRRSKIKAISEISKIEKRTNVEIAELVSASAVEPWLRLSFFYLS